MRIYNIEIFDAGINYKCSAQTEDIKYEFDYLDVDKNKIKFAKRVETEKGDFIRIKGGRMNVTGVISDVKDQKRGFTVEYKPLNKIFDVDLYINMDNLQGNTIEGFLNNIISAEWINNADPYQNIQNMTVHIGTTTPPESGLDFESGIINLFDLIIECFTTYGIVLNFTLDPQNKGIVLTIKKEEAARFVIEADLDNIFDKTIVYKDAKEDKNKVYIYNKDDYTQSAVYYMDAATNTVTKTPAERYMPVIETSKTVTVKTKTEDGVTSDDFEEKALAKATSTLKEPQYKNLIEVETALDDEIVRPLERKIGQPGVIISEGVSYSSVLTGLEIDGTKCKLVFGAIRLELTKLIKQRWRKENEY